MKIICPHCGEKIKIKGLKVLFYNKKSIKKELCHKCGKSIFDGFWDKFLISGNIASFLTLPVQFILIVFFGYIGYFGHYYIIIAFPICIIAFSFFDIIITKIMFNRYSKEKLKENSEKNLEENKINTEE